MILYRTPDTTKFTSVKPARIGSISYSLPRLGFTPPVTSLKLAPEVWRELGCPDQMTLAPYEPDAPEAEAVVAPGGWVAPPPEQKDLP